ncbi:DUF3696 domain-containing protein [Demequina silvatica]|uniref:DUF3696 domain-containing protein n=1 Tax=Demequina silvatica TaxID=1638988 RepID=UPI0009E4FBE0|nr:AAA family ATPase [Demequina silvatica]
MPDGITWLAAALTNFRAFEQTGRIDYAPVTLLFGRNSSGKTSILRAPLLLKQFLEQPPGREPGFSGADVDFGSYLETVHNGDPRRDISISAELDFRSLTIGLPRELASLFEGHPDSIPGRFTFELTLHWNIKRSRTVVSRIVFKPTPSSSPIIEMLRTGPGKHTVSVGGGRKQKINGELLPQTLRYSALRQNNAQVDREFDYSMFSLGIVLELAAQRLVHIGPLRDQPSRAYRTDQVGVSTTRDSIEVLRQGGKTAATVAQALKDLKMADDIKIDKLAPGYSAILLSEPLTGRLENLADVGFGVSQVLPIITTLVTAEAGSTVLIEQPELHLHPEAQGNFADVMLQLARENKLGLVIETHSEHILLRLQRRIADTTIGPEHVAAYFVDRGEVRRSPIDKRGRLAQDAVPDGFFEEDWKDLMELTAAAAKAAR